jgi:cell wall-associated NlpC family hydrolase
VGEYAWATALSLIGTPFRLHGRDPATGLDCVGLVAAAYGVRAVPERYRLCGPELAVAEAWLRACGAVPVRDGAAVGDIIVLDMGSGGRRQMHLVLHGPLGVVHAHAGLRRVVLSPEPGGVMLGRWRINLIRTGASVGSAPPRPLPKRRGAMLAAG